MFSLMGNCISCIGKRRQPKRQLTFAILGLDSAGKTTTTKALLAESLDTAPTIGFNKEEFTHSNNDITLYDLGGGKKIRDIWKNYLAEVYGFIYVVDSSCRERLPEVKDNLEKLLEHEQVQGKPLLMLANKQDLQNTMDEVDLCEQLSLEELVNTNKCPCKMEMCSAIKGTGKKMDAHIKSGLDWLCSVVEQCYDTLTERIQKDMDLMEKKRLQELAIKRERVRKNKEERERREAEEKKRLGIEENEDEEEDEDIIEGGPFRRVDDKFRADLQRKDAVLKEKKKKLKEKEHQSQKEERPSTEDTSKTAMNGRLDNDEDIPFRAPRSSRSLQSYGLFNGNAQRTDSDNVLSHRSGDEDNDDYLSRFPTSRKKLPPLQTPLGTKFVEEQQAKPNGKKKIRMPADIEEENMSNRNDPFSQSQVSMSRIAVAPSGAPSSGEEDIAESSSRRSYQPSVESGDAPNSGRKKKGKKKKGKTLGTDEGAEFDTLRLSPNPEEEEQAKSHDIPVYGKPPNKMRGLKSLDGEDYKPQERSLTPVKKLKKKKPLLRKNKLAPSDDEFELSDVQNSPKKQALPWGKTQDRTLESPDLHVPVSKWGMAEDLPEVRNSPMRPRPNFDSEDDQIL